MVAKEARHKAEVEAARLEVEQISLLLEIVGGGGQKIKCLPFGLKRARTK